MKQQSLQIDFLHSTRTRILRSGTWLAVMGVLSGCAINTQPSPIPSSPLREPQQVSALDESLQAEQTQDVAGLKRDRFAITPGGSQ